MKYIKHEKHGYLAVPQVLQTDLDNGWIECDIYKEINSQKKEEDVQVIEVDTVEEEKPKRRYRRKV